MFERLTERGRQVFSLARTEAHAMKHSYLGTEHLLLGLLREEEGLAARVLGDLGLTVVEVRNEVVRICGIGECASDGQLEHTPRAKKVFELALREALSLGHNYIGTEHILLGLVRENEGVAARILLNFDVDAEQVRLAIVYKLTGRRPKPQKVWSRDEVRVGQLYERGGRVFHVVAISDEPSVTLEDVANGMLDAYPIGSPLFGGFARLRKEQA